MNRNGQTREKVQGEILQLILKVLKEVLENQGKRLPRMSADTTLYGRGSDVDSLGLVQLLIDLEERVADQYGAPIRLTDERAMSQQNSPFRTGRSLTGYVAALILEGKG